MKATDETVNKKPVALHAIVSDNKVHPIDKKYLIKASWIEINPSSVKKWGKEFALIWKDLVNN